MDTLKESNATGYHNPYQNYPQAVLDTISEATTTLVWLSDDQIDEIGRVTHSTWPTTFDRERAAFNAAASLAQSGGYDLSHEIQHLGDSPELTAIGIDQLSLRAAIDYLSATLAKSYGTLDQRFTEQEHDMLVSPWCSIS